MNQANHTIIEKETIVGTKYPDILSASAYTSNVSTESLRNTSPAPLPSALRAFITDLYTMRALIARYVRFSLNWTKTNMAQGGVSEIYV